MTVDLRVDVWWTESVSTSTVDRVEDAIENLADQLGTGSHITRMGEFSGEDNHDTYEEYMSEFETEETHYPGFRSLLIYKRYFKPGEGGSRHSHPNLGMSRDIYRSDETSYAIVNGNLLETSLTNLAWFFGIAVQWFADREQKKIFENVVQHEILHAMLDDSRSPNADTDHSFGEVKSAWYRVRDRTSPMLTGYVEPGSANTTPDELCRKDSTSAKNWTDTLSNCTEVEGVRWLNSEYYDDGDGGPPPCQPGEPC